MNGSATPNYASLGLAFIPIATVMGNLLVIVSILTVRGLHIRINFLILALACTDLLLAAFVMPFAVYVEVNNGQWDLGILPCDLYLSCDVTCSTASILLLALISYDRYEAATKPYEYANDRKNYTRLTLAIVICWLSSAAIASPVVLGINDTPGRKNLTECRFYNENFMIMSGMASFYVPTVAILGLYYKIFKVIKERGRIQRERAKLTDIADYQANVTVNPGYHSPHLLAVTIQMEIPHIRLGTSVSFSDRADVAKFDASEATANGPRAQSVHSCLTATSSTFTVLDEEIDFIDDSPNLPRKVTPIAKAETFDTPLEDREFEKDIPAPPERKKRLCSSSSISTRRGTTSSARTSSFSVDNLEQRNRPLGQLLLYGAEVIATASTAMFSLRHYKRRRDSDEDEFAIRSAPGRPTIRLSAKRKARRKMSKANRKERKATKTLAVVLGVYLLCWCPFFVTSLTNAICLKLHIASCQVGFLPFFLTTWLGYMNSFMNPAIYTIFSDEFRRAFKLVLCCHSQHQYNRRHHV